MWLDSNNNSTLYKAIIGAVSGFISFVVGGLGVAMTVLLGLMIIDIATGLLVGAAGVGLSSSVGIKGLIRKVYIILLISAVYLVQTLSGFDLAGYTGDGLAGMFSVMEAVSIIENGDKLGIKWPKIFYSFVAALKKQIGEDEEDKKDGVQSE